MASWKRPVRGFFRNMRKVHLIPHIEIKWLSKINVDLRRMILVPLDIVPGLGHLLGGSFKKVWWLVLLWVVFLIAGILHIPDEIGFLFIGLAIGLHVWIFMRHSIIKETKSFTTRLMVAFLILIFLFFSYRTVGSMLFSNRSTVHIAFDIPGQDIEKGDIFLVNKQFSSEALKRGNLVSIQPERAREDTEMIGQIIALPGEYILVKEDFFVVNRRKLDNKQYPVPGWLRGREVSFKMSEDSYFVILGYYVSEHGRSITKGEIQSICIYSFDEIKGVAYMKWLPLHKRGPLQE